VKNNLHYNFRDIVSVPSAALKAKKIFIASAALLAALAVYDIFIYMGFIIDGFPLPEAFGTYGLLPLQLTKLESTLGVLVYYTGIVTAAFFILTGMIAIAIIDLEKFRGNRFCTASRAIKFACVRLKQLFMSLLTVVLFVLFIVLLGYILGLISRIPYLGDLIYTVMFFFPNFIISLLTVVVIFVFTTGLVVMPAAVAADRKGETFNSILGTFSTILRQPARWIAYTAYTLIAAKICSFIFAYFCFRAVQFLKIITAFGGGEKTNMLIASGLAKLPLHSPAAGFTFNIFPGVNFGFDISSLSGAAAGGGFLSYLIAFSLFLVFLTIWGYIFSIVATGQTYAYVILRKLREGYMITDEKPVLKE